MQSSQATPSGQMGGSITTALKRGAPHSPTPIGEMGGGGRSSTPLPMGPMQTITAPATSPPRKLGMHWTAGSPVPTLTAAPAQLHPTPQQLPPLSVQQALTAQQPPSVQHPFTAQQPSTAQLPLTAQQPLTAMQQAGSDTTQPQPLDPFQPHPTFNMSLGTGHRAGHGAAQGVRQGSGQRAWQGGEAGTGAGRADIMLLHGRDGALHQALNRNSQNSQPSQNGQPPAMHGFQLVPTALPWASAPPDPPPPASLLLLPQPPSHQALPPQPAAGQSTHTRTAQLQQAPSKTTSTTGPGSAPALTNLRPPVPLPLPTTPPAHVSLALPALVPPTMPPSALFQDPEPPSDQPRKRQHTEAPGPMPAHATTAPHATAPASLCPVAGDRWEEGVEGEEEEEGGQGVGQGGAGAATAVLLPPPGFDHEHYLTVVLGAGEAGGYLGSLPEGEEEDVLVGAGRGIAPLPGGGRRMEGGGQGDTAPLPGSGVEGDSLGPAESHLLGVPPAKRACTDTARAQVSAPPSPSSSPSLLPPPVAAGVGAGGRGGEATSGTCQLLLASTAPIKPAAESLPAANGAASNAAALPHVPPTSIPYATAPIPAPSTAPNPAPTAPPPGLPHQGTGRQPNCHAPLPPPSLAFSSMGTESSMGGSFPCMAAEPSTTARMSGGAEGAWLCGTLNACQR